MPRKFRTFENPVNLFDGFDFIPAEPVAAAVVVAVTVPEPVEEIPVIAEEIPVQAPEPVTGVIAAATPSVWSERAETAAQVAGKPYCVVLQKSGSSHVAVVPQDFQTSVWLKQIKATIWAVDVNRKGNPMLQETSVKVHAKDGRMHFPLEFMLDNSNPYETSLVKLLRDQYGLSVVLTLSFQDWIVRQHRYQLRAATPIDLPVTEDKRSLYDQAEIGLMLRCTKPEGSFRFDAEYVVTDTDRIDTEEGEEEAEKEEKGFITLRRQGGSRDLIWPATQGPMEENFELASDVKKAFDPENTFPKKYPKLYAANLAHVQSLNLPIYKTHEKDLAQAISYRRIMALHPPRMGKTSFGLGYAEAKGVKRTLVMTVANGVQVIAKEARRMGIDGVVVVKRLKDFYKPGRYYIMAHSFLASYGPGSKDVVSNTDKSFPLAVSANCPHCGKPLMRLKSQPVIDPETGRISIMPSGRVLTVHNRVIVEGADGEQRPAPDWTSLFGYLCTNKDCSYTKRDTVQLAGGKDVVPAKVHGGAWQDGRGYKLKAYIDTDRARHSECLRKSEALGTEAPGFVTNSKGASCQCRGCGFVPTVRMHPMARRLRKIIKHFGLVILDESHAIKNEVNEISKLMFGMNARNQIIMTGSLMPTTPLDSFNQLSWLFGGPNTQFEFERGGTGKAEFKRKYCQEVVLSSGIKNQKKVVPYISRPMDFWKWKASKVFFRTQDDPEMVAALEAAGLFKPKLIPRPIELLPHPSQGMLLIGAVQQFQEAYQGIENSNRTSFGGVGIAQLNQISVLSKMHDMRYAATIPGHLNDKIVAQGRPAVYSGEYGGAKIDHVRSVVAEKAATGEKVVIYSDMKPMQELLERELSEYNPIRFLTQWSADRRDRAFEQFQEDDVHMVWIAGPRSVREAVDLSRANTIITTDLLWSPGLMMQAWSRVLTPRTYAREVDCQILLTKYSVDLHQYNTFYARNAAFEQACYNSQITKTGKKFDLRYFVDLIVSEKERIQEWLIDTQESTAEFMPLIHSLHQIEEYGVAA